MNHQEIKIGQVTYELRRVFSGTLALADLIREKLETAGAIDRERHGAV